MLWKVGKVTYCISVVFVDKLITIDWQKDCHCFKVPQNSFTSMVWWEDSLKKWNSKNTFPENCCNGQLKIDDTYKVISKARYQIMVKLSKCFSKRKFCYILIKAQVNPFREILKKTKWHFFSLSFWNNCHSYKVNSEKNPRRKNWISIDLIHFELAILLIKNLWHISFIFRK